MITIIESRPLDALGPNATAYEIVGLSRDAVQQEITKLTNSLDGKTAYGEFRNPYPAGGRWVSRGYINNLALTRGEGI